MDDSVEAILSPGAGIVPDLTPANQIEALMAIIGGRVVTSSQAKAEHALNRVSLFIDSVDTETNEPIQSWVVDEIRKILSSAND